MKQAYGGRKASLRCALQLSTVARGIAATHHGLNLLQDLVRSLHDPCPPTEVRNHACTKSQRILIRNGTVYLTNVQPVCGSVVLGVRTWGGGWGQRPGGWERGEARKHSGNDVLSGHPYLRKLTALMTGS